MKVEIVEKRHREPSPVWIKKGIHVACGTDKLVLEEVQLEGKKRMETDAFLRGYQVTEGIMLKDHKE